MIRFVLFTLIDLVVYAFNGLILSVLWKWFVTPVFHLPVLTVPQAIGLVLVMSLATLRYTANEFEDHVSIRATIQSKIMSNFSVPLALLFVGWLFHKFIL